MKITLIALLFSMQIGAQVCQQASQCAKEFWVQNSFLRYYQSHQDGDSKIEKVIIVVHGALRNGDEYFEHMVDSAKLNNALDRAMVVAPHFRKVNDTRSANELYWGRNWYEKWKYGYKSQNTHAISSFAVIDQLILDLLKRFPNIKDFVLTGHSAGGQFTQRYAIGTDIHKKVAITFVPSNPSSYMYLHRVRYKFVNGNFTEIVRRDCPEFNHYIYGPVNRNDYLAKKSVAELRTSFAEKNIVYLMSEQDKGEDSLDKTCEANRQGKNRINRAQNFYYYLNKNFDRYNHRFVGISNIGHDHQKVFNSKEASAVIFKTKKLDGTKHFSYRKIGFPNFANGVMSKSFLLLGGGKNEAKGISSFLRKLKGGNLLVISGKDRLHHRYTFDMWRLAEEAKIKISTVETISFHSKLAGGDPFVLGKIANANGIFFTGGNQAKYIKFIKGTLAHQEIISRSIPIAGTSAGLAIMGEYIFAAREGGVSSNYALQKPNSSVIDIEQDFFYSRILSNLITDSHFNKRNREGRLLSFMASAQSVYKTGLIYGIGIDEQTSVHMQHDSMVSYGKGHAVLYFKGRPHTNGSGPLSYSNIKKLILRKNTTHAHYSRILLDQAEILNVIDGRVK